VRVISKSDLQGSRTHGSPGSLPDIEGIEVSARSGAGLEHLRGAIFSRLAGAESLVPGEMIITEARHHDALRRALERLAAARTAMEAGMTEEIWLADLHAAQSHIGEITGRVTMEDVYDRIFSSFCVGK
jgi:tRNA modification GTPase